jgi:type IV secretory pathway TrbF-like protein
MEVDSVGNYKVTNMTATEYSPSENEVRARIKEMVERMFTLDAQFTKRNISKAESLMSGQARKQFEEFLFKEQPFARLVKSPALFREVKVHAVTKIEEKALHVDFTTIEREGTGEPKPVRKAMTLRYEVKAPETDDEVLGDNPSGIFVINFAIADRLN